MLEVKVTIQAADLSEAITQLALAIKGDVVMDPGQREFVVPAGTQMTVENVVPATTPQEAPVQNTAVPTETAQPVQNTAAPVQQTQVPVNTGATPVQPPVMNTPKLDLDTISRAGAALVNQGKMNDVLKVLQEKYGIFAVTQLREDQFEAFAEDLRALGAAI